MPYAFLHNSHKVLHLVSQPTLRREGDTGLTGASSMGGKCADSPPTFIQGKRHKKPERCGLRTLSVKGSGVVFMHREGISTPRVRHKGTTTFNQNVQYHVFTLFYFPFFMGLSYFLSFCGRQGCFSRSYVSIAMRKSDLCSSLRTKRWFKLFLSFFSQDIF